MSRLQIIVGSTRPERNADRVLPWVTRRAEENESFEVEVLDLRDWPLPMFQEHAGTIGDIADPTFSEPIVKRWNTKIGEGDAYLVITPEYNHSIPGVLKNALDSVFASFAMRNKPIACVSYSGAIAGGVRAIEHMAQIAVEADMAPLRSSVIIPFVQSSFDDAGEPVNKLTDVGMGIVLDDLAWWSKALENARAEGTLPPGQFRMRAAQS